MHLGIMREMNAVQLARTQADGAYRSLLEALDGVSEGQAWAVLPNLGPDYLHTDASIQGTTLHIATCKFIYGSCAFRNTEIRWRDLAARLDEFEPSWAAARAYLDEAHAYWMASWEHLEDIEAEVPRFSGELWPAWKIIHTVTHHDGWHGGQIAMLRYGVAESNDPPPSSADDIRKYCAELPSW